MHRPLQASYRSTTHRIVPLDVRKALAQPRRQLDA